MTQEQEFDRNELKILAYRERVAGLTSEYEEKVADLRIELTISEEKNRSLTARLAELEAPSEDVDDEVKAKKK